MSKKRNKLVSNHGENVTLLIFYIILVKLLNEKVQKHF